MMKAIMMQDSRSLSGRIHDYVSKLDAELGIERVYLFGSTAKRIRRKNSDVDLIIVSKAFIGMPVPKREGILENLWDYREDLEALAYTPEEFAKISQRLTMREILSYAIELTPPPRRSVNKVCSSHPS